MGEPLSAPLPSLYDGAPGADGLQFKAAFVRHLGYLLEALYTHYLLLTTYYLLLYTLYFVRHLGYLREVEAS